MDRTKTDDRPRVLVSLRGTPAYRRYLDRLAKALAKAGVKVAGTHRLGEYALAFLGAQHGLKAPPRMPPMGGPREGSGRPPKEIEKTKESQESGIDS